MKKLYYEAISGPQRGLKSALLPSFAMLMIVGPGTYAAGYPSASILIATLYVGGLGVLLVLLQLRGSAKLNDLHYQLSLQVNLDARNYRIQDLYLDGAAANPSLMMLLWKCLHMCEPRSVLELGSGQTTKLLSAYFETHPETYVLTLEQDARWVEVLRPSVTRGGRCHDYRHARLTAREFSSPGTGVIRTEWFDDRSFTGRTFDLVLVDGPNGGRHYSRAGVLEFMPQMLGESFIVIFDDAERYGEIMTIKAFEALLEATKVAYTSFAIDGVKRQVVFCSPNYEFLRYS